MNTLRRPVLARGFTLIEVLIGVLVLALGLLGLGAIIPVVIREQRIAVMQTLGNEAASAAKKYLLGRPDLNPATPFDFNETVTPWREQPTIGWDAWLLDASWSPEGPPIQPPQANSYLWVARRASTIAPPAPPDGINPDTGDFGWNVGRTVSSGPTRLYVKIGLADRLWPNETMQGEAYLRPGLDPHQPQFVWDFIGRRVQTRPGEPRQLQVAVFVRQLDLNIRVPRGNHSSIPQTPITLRDVVLGRNLPNPGDARVPVCSQPLTAGAALQFLPTNTGILPDNTTRQYSEPIFIDAQFDPAEPGRIEFQNLSRTDNAWKLVSQSGQKILDNLGNVYTVRGIPDELEPGNLGASTEVLIDPPVPGYVPDSATNALGTIRQVVFTPQIPVAIEVFTITRTMP